MKPDDKQLMAWNCDLRNSLEFSEFSLMKVETCHNIASQYSPPLNRSGQVVQARKYMDLPILECKLVASFYTAYCSFNLISGYRLWDSQGHPSHTNIDVELSLSECENAITTNILKYQDRTYYAKQSFLSIDLSPAHTASGWLTLRGNSDAVKGTCIPESFNLGRNLYPSHVLTMKYDISIKRMQAVFNTEKRLIRISDHILIPNTLSGSFYSPTLGNYHWQKVDQGNLTDNHWLEIARGNVKIYFPSSSNSSMPIGIIETNETGASLALSLTEQTTLCLSYSCRQAHKTQLKDVYLVLYNPIGQSHWPLETIAGSEVSRLLNLEASIASIYLTRELRLVSTFERISLELCQRNREIILSNIQDYINNVLIQQDTKETRGRHFIRSGSVLYSVNCKEEIAWLRANDTNCYEHAPIYYKDNNKKIISGFINPVTYVIQPNSNVKRCNDILPFKFNLMSIDGTTEWICRTSQGWNVDCRAPRTLSPMQPETLYVANDKVIVTNLYSQSQLDSLENLQWEKVEEQIDLKEWENYLQKIKKDNPSISTMTYFENLKNAIDSVTDIFSTSFWVRQALKHLMPLVFLNYVFHVILSIIKSLITFKKEYKTQGFGLTMIVKSGVSVLTAFFPVFGMKGFNTPKPKVCKCEEDDFIDDMAKEIEQRERQRFLRNLEL